MGQDLLPITSSVILANIMVMLGGSSRQQLVSTAKQADIDEVRMWRNLYNSHFGTRVGKSLEPFRWRDRYALRSLMSIGGYATIESHSTSARSMGQGWPWRDKCDDPSLLHFAAQEGNLRVLDIILSLGSDKVEQQAKSDLDDGLKPIDEKIFVAMALQSGSAQILEVLSRALGEANGVDPPRILDWKSKGLVLKDNLNPCEWLDESLGTPTNSMVTMYEPTYLFWLCFGRPGECGQYGHRFGRKHGGQYEPIDVLELPERCSQAHFEGALQVRVDFMRRIAMLGVDVNSAATLQCRTTAQNQHNYARFHILDTDRTTRTTVLGLLRRMRGFWETAAQCAPGRRSFKGDSGAARNVKYIDVLAEVLLEFGATGIEKTGPYFHSPAGSPLRMDVQGGGGGAEATP